jgi:hypothetical protein
MMRMMMTDKRTVHREFGDRKPGGQKRTRQPIDRATTDDAPPPLALDETLLALVPRGRGELFRLTLATYDGHLYISARVFRQSSLGDWFPTKKGMSIRLSELDQVIAALESAGDLAAAHGTDSAARGSSA